MYWVCAYNSCRTEVLPEAASEATCTLVFNMPSNWLFMLLCCLIWLSALWFALKRGNLTVTLSLTVKWHHKLKNVRFRFSHFADILAESNIKKVDIMGCQMHYGWAACHPRFQGHIRLAYYHKISNEKLSVEYYGHLMTKYILQSKEKDIASAERHLKYVQSTFLLKHVTRFQQRLIQISATTWQKKWIWIHCKSQEGQWIDWT